MQGGPPPAQLIASSRPGGAASPHAVTALVCALAGYLTESSLRPPPQGLPTIRAFQAAHATIARQRLSTHSRQGVEPRRRLPCAGRVHLLLHDIPPRRP
jgi:hypothetical protein